MKLVVAADIEFLLVVGFQRRGAEAAHEASAREDSVGIGHVDGDALEAGIGDIRFFSRPFHQVGMSCLHGGDGIGIERQRRPAASRPGGVNFLDGGSCQCCSRYRERQT